MLRARGYQVRALARSTAAANTVANIGAEPIMGDLDNDAALRTGMSGCQVVFHCAATLGDWGRYEDFYHGNVVGSERVIAAARDSGVARLVHVSTEAVLVGGRPIVNADETWPRPAHPQGLYPITKGLAEERVMAANSPTFATIIVRPRFIWGKGDSSVLPRVVEAVQTGKFSWIEGGYYPTSTCHVTNVCEGMLLAAERGRGGEIYFLTDGEPVEVRSFLTAMLHTQGVDPGRRSVPRWLAHLFAWGAELCWRIFHLKGMPPASRLAVRLIGEEVTVNDAKARRELGYQATISRDAGLAAMAKREA
jgi:nucleoside-diphosphate-sugar epimerase